MKSRSEPLRPFRPGGRMPAWLVELLAVVGPCGSRLRSGTSSRRPHSFTRRRGNTRCRQRRKPAGLAFPKRKGRECTGPRSRTQRGSQPLAVIRVSPPRSRVAVRSRRSECAPSAARIGVVPGRFHYSLTLPDGRVVTVDYREPILPVVHAIQRARDMDDPPDAGDLEAVTRWLDEHAEQVARCGRGECDHAP